MWVVAKDITLANMPVVPKNAHCSEKDTNHTYEKCFRTPGLFTKIRTNMYPETPGSHILGTL